MVAHYDNLGIQFAYPENWSTTDEEHEEALPGVSVQSPSGAYWDVKIFAASADPTQVCDQALAAMRDVYENIESEAVAERLFDVPAVGYNLDFFCLDFLVTAQLRCFRVGQRVLLVTCQAESQEFAQQQVVFQAITKSLFSD